MEIHMVLIEELEKLAGKEWVRQQESMAAHTTFRIGGPAAYYVEVGEEQVLRQVLRLCRESGTPFFILGNGSNLLVADEGYDGVMISLDRFQTIRFLEKEAQTGRQLVAAGAGLSLSKVANEVAKKGLAGFEFAGGIPGTLGGAVTMNAGAYGGEMKDVLVGATVMTPDGEVTTLTGEELELSYRHSIVQENGAIVLEALLAFSPGEPQEILSSMRELNRKRREKQPLEYGSGGSTFKRPAGYFAAKLIEDAGLKGYRVGDVMVSEKHSGFVVNTGNGTYRDAMQVIRHVQETVRDKFGVELELEIKCLGGGQ
jgi:UDP-N-acetylmuramate dehydrogenase